MVNTFSENFRCNTLFVAQNFVVLPSVNSTNNYLAKLVSKEIMEGTAIFAGIQTAGKGQNGAVWQSEAYKNILTSVLLYPKFLDISQQFLLSQAVALAVFDFVREYIFDDIYVKFPNDIYYKNNKVGGILIENTVNNGVISASIVGVGININQLYFDKNLPNATSLACVTHQIFDLAQVLARFYACLEGRYLMLKAQKHTQISTEYTRNMLGYQALRQYEVAGSGEIFSGEILGVANGNKLAIQMGSAVRLFAHKEIKFLF